MDLPEPERAAEIGRALAWADLKHRIPREDLEAKIDLRLALLADLPEDQSTLVTRAQLLYTLATLYGEKVFSTSRFAIFGIVYAALGRRDEAVAAFQKAIQLDPKVPFPHGNLADLYVTLGRLANSLPVQVIPELATRARKGNHPRPI